ncbi:MAG: hypothetical protein ACHQU0_00775 [Candidatus Paceibacteria bacterium]
MTVNEGIAQVSTLATHSALTIWNFGSDFLIIIIPTAAFFFFAWYVGRGPFVAILLAFYSAFAIYNLFPYMSILPTAPAITAFLAHTGLYLALSFAFYIVLRRVVVSDFLYVGTIGLTILSFCATAFLLALAHHTFGVNAIYTFTPPVDALFSPDKYFFWWFIAPAVGLFFLAR